MNYLHRTVRIKQGESVVLDDGAMMIGSNLEAVPDKPGEFRIVLHVLEVTPSPKVAQAVNEHGSERRM